MTTPIFGWTLPTVGGSSGTWGGSLNGNLSALDTTLGAVLSATGNLITPGGTNVSAAAWTTNAIRAEFKGATYTDTSSSGTVAAVYVDAHKAATIAASSATTYTNAYGAYFEAPAAGQNVTLTNAFALGADSLKVNGNVTVASAGTVTMPDSATWTSGGISGLTALIAGRTTAPSGYLNAIKTANGAIASALAIQDGNPTNGNVLIAFMDAGGTNRGSIAWNGTTAVQYNTTSDERLKTRTGAISSGAMMDAVSPHTFTWNENGESDFGFFAQELHAVVPGVVHPGSTEGFGDPKFKPWMLDCSKLVPILWAEIQSLRARLKAASIP